jgi:hypothetical protein
MEPTNHATLFKRIWYERTVSVFLERFLLVVCASIFVGVVFFNIMRIDGHYRFGIALVVVGLAYIIAHAVNQKPVPATVEPIQTTIPTDSFHLKYSSTQVVQRSNEPGYKDELHLAEVATMFSCGGDRDSIQMVLAASPPLTIDNPRPGDSYKMPGGITVKGLDKLPPSISIEMRDVRVATGDKSFIFNRLKPSSMQHIVEVASRRFKVTLLGITDHSTKSKALLEYTFGISEE